jgi:hypothetical protein
VSNPDTRRKRAPIGGAEGSEPASCRAGHRYRGAVVGAVKRIAWSTDPARTSDHRSSPGRIGSPAASADVHPAGRRALDRRFHTAPDPARHPDRPCAGCSRSRRVGIAGRPRPPCDDRCPPRCAWSGARDSAPDRFRRRSRNAPWCAASAGSRDRDPVLAASEVRMEVGVPDARHPLTATTDARGARRSARSSSCPRGTPDSPQGPASKHARRSHLTSSARHASPPCGHRPDRSSGRSTLSKTVTALPR